MDINSTFQLLLPIDKGNPSFSLYLDQDKKNIHVFYGFERFEIVPNDREHLAFRMMVGRLYNAKIKTATLSDVFHLDRKTIRSWGLAILSRNPQLLTRMMLGRAAKQKRTADIDRVVMRRRAELLSEGCHNYRHIIAQEIEIYFDVKLSGETIRQIVIDKTKAAEEKACVTNISVPSEPPSPPLQEEPPNFNRQHVEYKNEEFNYSPPSLLADASSQNSPFVPVEQLDHSTHDCNCYTRTPSQSHLILEKTEEITCVLCAEATAETHDNDQAQMLFLLSKLDTTQHSPFVPVEQLDDSTHDSNFYTRTPSQSEIILEKTEEITCVLCTETPAETPDEALTTELAQGHTAPWMQASAIEAFASVEIEPQSKDSPPNWRPEPGDTILCNHVGVLLFASALCSISQALKPESPLMTQWLSCILLGAVNVEQTKYLNWDDLDHMFHHLVRFPTPQREQLSRLADTTTIDAILRWNVQQLKISPEDNDFYYDPHTSQYTGIQSVLKGWCAAIRWADKLINSDYIHTAQGHPIYFECTDNFEDLRMRFLPLISRMRTSLQWAPERILTFVVDRGIFSYDVFTQVLADPTIHLITWEKGYQAQKDQDWESLTLEHGKTHGSHVFTRCRNHAQDVQFYHFEYIARPWKNNPAIRQIIVRATNPRKKTVQIAILTDDWERPIEGIVNRMFNRWVQENDFKYLNKHFGINQLTSYKSTPYEQLRDQLKDREVPNLDYLKKVQIGRKLKREHARQLQIEDQAQRMESKRQAEVKNIRCAIASAGTTATLEEKKAIQRIRNASKRYDTFHKIRTQKIIELGEQITQNELEKGEIEKEVSRIDQCIKQDMVRMDLKNKTLMDTLKICARNLFYLLLAPFRANYNNYRDDHQYFRALTQSDGLLRWTGSVIEVHIMPQVNYSPKLKNIIKEHLESLNATGLMLPDGSRRPLRLHLTSKEQISVRINDPVEN